MAEILGKVTAPNESPRGADVSLRVSVPRLWLFEGRTIEVELPRNLTCAQCFGGGCSVCGNSGAITVRGRGELPEMIQVSLPEQGKVEPSSSSHDPPSQDPALCDSTVRDIPPARQPPRVSAGPRDNSPRDSAQQESPSSVRLDAPRSVRPVTIRIPECGGLPDSGTVGTVRGWLLLHVTIADEPTPNVRLLDVDPLSSSKMLRAEVKSMARTPLARAEGEGGLHAPGNDAARGTAAPTESGRAAVPSRPPRTVSVRVRGTAHVQRKDLDATARAPSGGRAIDRRLPRFAAGVGLTLFVAGVVLVVLWYVR